MNYDTRHNQRRAVTADDGRELPITAFEPTVETRGVVLVVPAMATPSSYYAPLASHLAESGWRAVTFDYRGRR